MSIMSTSVTQNYNFIINQIIILLFALIGLLLNKLCVQFLGI